MKIFSTIIILFFLVSALAPLVLAQNETREEILAWVAKLDKQDAKIQKEADNARYQQDLNYCAGARANLWSPETVLKRIAEWKIAHLMNETEKELVRKAYQEAVKHIELIWDAWSGEHSGSGATEFAGTAAAELSRRQIALWLLPDDEYKEWMATWSNARLLFQGKEIPLTSGMAHAKERKNDRDQDEVEFLLKHENCYTFDGEKYAFVEKNYVACPSDDFNRVYLFRLNPDGVAILIEEVVREHYVKEIKLSKESECCLRVEWQEVGEKKKESTWVLLLE